MNEDKCDIPPPHPPHGPPSFCDGKAVDFGMRTLEGIIEQCGADSEDWFPKQAHDLFWQAACTSGEAGELLNEAKKLVRNHVANPSNVKKVEEEAIDVLIYLCNIFYILDTDVIGRYNDKRTANAERFGPGTNRTDPAGE